MIRLLRPNAKARGNDRKCNCSDTEHVRLRYRYRGRLREPEPRSRLQFPRGVDLNGSATRGSCVWTTSKHCYPSWSTNWRSCTSAQFDVNPSRRFEDLRRSSRNSTWCRSPRSCITCLIPRRRPLGLRVAAGIIGPFQAVPGATFEEIDGTIPRSGGIERVE